MKAIISLVIIAAVVAIVVIISNSISKSKQYTRNDVYGNRDDLFVYDTLGSAFSKKDIFKKLFMPIYVNDALFWVESDIVLITHGGVVSLKLCDAKGNIDTFAKEAWVQHSGDGDTVIQNPYSLNAVRVSAIKNALNNEGISKIPVYNLVVLVNAKAKISNKFPWLVKLNQLNEVIGDIDDKVVLNNKDKKLLRAAMNHYKAKKSPLLDENTAFQKNYNTKSKKSTLEV